MGRRGIHRGTAGGTPPSAHRELAYAVADGTRDIFHPLIVIGRGLRTLMATGRRTWAQTPRERRGPALLLTASCLAILALIPYGPPLVAAAVMGAGAWAGRGRGHRETGEAESARLQTLYDALVPYFSVPEDPKPLYQHGGHWPKAFEEHAFDDEGRLSSLRLRYPAYFADGEEEPRARVEQLLHLKAGRGREYRFDWDEEANRLTLSALPPLPADIAAQRFVTAPGETVLGFTDPGDVQRTLPVGDGEEMRDAPPVVWRTGPRSAEPHLLALGRPGGGTTTLLRSVTLQALHHGGDVVVVDGGGTGEYACLTGREGVLAVETSLTGALAILEWACHETERRLTAAGHARQLGCAVPEDVRRPLWIVVDRPVGLSQLATGQGRTDPQELLAVPLRHGRVTGVTVVIGEQLDAAGRLAEPVWTAARARAVLGAAGPDRTTAALGAPPHTTAGPELPPGRGYARLGSGPVHRLQVPATPDPYDEEADEAQRGAVLALLPVRTAALPSGVEAVPWSGYEEELPAQAT